LLIVTLVDNYIQIVQLLEGFDVRGFEEPELVTRGGDFMPTLLREAADNAEITTEDDEGRDDDEAASLLRKMGSKNELSLM